MYSERLMQWFHSRRHGGLLEDATHFGQAGEPGGGPYIQLWLRVEDGIVQAARWRTYGCPAAMACSEAICAVSEGKHIGALRGVSSEDVCEWVGGVPEGKEHCVDLAATACRTARAIPSTVVD